MCNPVPFLLQFDLKIKIKFQILCLAVKVDVQENIFAQHFPHCVLHYTTVYYTTTIVCNTEYAE